MANYYQCNLVYLYPRFVLYHSTSTLKLPHKTTFSQRHLPCLPFSHDYDHDLFSTTTPIYAYLLKIKGLSHFSCSSLFNFLIVFLVQHHILFAIILLFSFLVFCSFFSLFLFYATISVDTGFPPPQLYFLTFQLDKHWHIWATATYNHSICNNIFFFLHLLLYTFLYSCYVMLMLMLGLTVYEIYLPYSSWLLNFESTFLYFYSFFLFSYLLLQLFLYWGSRLEGNRLLSILSSRSISITAFPFPFLLFLSWLNYTNFVLHKGKGLGWVDFLPDSLCVVYYNNYNLVWILI